MRATELVTLPRTHVLYVSLVVLIVLPAIVGIVFSNAIGNAWCRQFEIPEYEKQLGFRMGPITVAAPEGGSYEHTGLKWVDPTGPLGRAGIRSADFPRMYHGIGDFCGDLSRVASGQTAQIEVINVEDLGRGRGHRRVTVTAGGQ